MWEEPTTLQNVVVAQKHNELVSRPYCDMMTLNANYEKNSVNVIGEVGSSLSEKLLQPQEERNIVDAAYSKNQNEYQLTPSYSQDEQQIQTFYNLNQYIQPTTNEEHWQYQNEVSPVFKSCFEKQQDYSHLINEAGQQSVYNNKNKCSTDFQNISRQTLDLGSSRYGNDTNMNFNYFQNSKQGSFPQSVGHDACYSNGVQLNRAYCEEVKNKPSVIVRVQTYTNCKVELPTQQNSSYLPFAALSEAPQQLGSTLGAGNKSWHSATNQTLESQTFNKPAQQYQDQSNSKNEIGTRAIVENEKYMFSPYEASPKQKEGKRLVFTEQRQTSIYIDYPATRDENLSVCQSSVANDLPFCPPYCTPLQNPNGQLTTTSQQNLIENNDSTKVHNFNQNGRVLTNQNTTDEQSYNFSKNFNDGNVFVPTPISKNSSDLSFDWSSSQNVYQQCYPINSLPTTRFESTNIIQNSNVSNSNYQNTILNTDNSFQQNEIAEKYNVLEINSLNYDTKKRKNIGKNLDSKKYFCTEADCPKRFSRPQDLQVHINKHHKKLIKPYVCNECLKAFKRPDQLKRHEKIHTGEKPHACKICGRCFARTDHRNMHQMKHTEEEKRQALFHFQNKGNEVQYRTKSRRSDFQNGRQQNNGKVWKAKLLWKSY